jgi:hypothetical protein
MKIVTIDEIESRVVEIRGVNVLLDSDVADVYGVATKEINQAAANNPEKFPQGYLFELSAEEKQEVVKNFDHLAKLKYSPHLPKAFTEKGLYMVATILKSDVATQTTLAIIETFARIRQLSRNLKQLNETESEAQQKALMRKSGEIIAEVLGEELATTDTETTVELNVAFLKVKHTIKRKRGEKDEG